MNKKSLPFKSTCLVLTILVLFITIPISGVSASESMDRSNKILQYGDNNQYYEEIENKDGSKSAIITILNSKTEDVTKIEVNEKSDIRTIKVFLNDKLDHTVIRDDSNYQLTFIGQNGKKEIYDVRDFVTQIEQKFDQPQALRDTPSYPLLQSKYSSTWQVWGYLYGDDSTSYGTTYILQFGEGTAVGIILAVLPSIFSINIGGIIYALGSAIIGTSIDTAINGKTKTRIYRWDYEVFCQGELGLVTYTTDTDAWVYDNNTYQASYVDLREGGDERSRSEMIDAGIYMVMVN